MRVKDGNFADKVLKIGILRRKSKRGLVAFGYQSDGEWYSEV